MIARTIDQKQKVSLFLLSYTLLMMDKTFYMFFNVSGTSTLAAFSVPSTLFTLQKMSERILLLFFLGNIALLTFSTLWFTALQLIGCG